MRKSSIFARFLPDFFNYFCPIFVRFLTIFARFLTIFPEKFGGIDAEGCQDFLVKC
jgi:hypothetical protein